MSRTNVATRTVPLALLALLVLFSPSILTAEAPAAAPVDRAAPAPSVPSETTTPGEESAAPADVADRPSARYPAPAWVGGDGPALSSSCFNPGSCAVDGICNTACANPGCGYPYDWDCASLACGVPNVCGATGGTCPPTEQCVGNVCVCFFGEA